MKTTGSPCLFFWPYLSAVNEHILASFLRKSVRISPFLHSQNRYPGMTWSKAHTSSVLKPHPAIRRQILAGIVRFTGNAKLKPWMQILHANFPVGEDESNQDEYKNYYQLYIYVTANLRNQIFPGIPNPFRESGEPPK